MLSSHVTRSPPFWLHNRSRLFHWCLFYKQNITCLLVDMNFIFSCSTRYVTSERSEQVRYRGEHEKIKFISTSGHVISPMQATLATSYVNTSYVNKQLLPFHVPLSSRSMTLDQEYNLLLLPLKVKTYCLFMLKYSQHRVYRKDLNRASKKVFIQILSDLNKLQILQP